MDEPRLRIVTARWWSLAIAWGLILMMVGMVVVVVQDKASALMCWGPVIPVAVLGIAVSLITQRVVHVDKEGITAAWEPYGIVTLDIPREDMTLITLEQVERTYLDINDIFVGTSTIVSWAVHVHLRDGREKAVLRGSNPQKAKQLADQLRSFLRL